MKKIAIIPTLLTLGNGICGFAAIALASKIGKIDPGNPVQSDLSFLTLAGWMIVAAMVFDALDGYVARLSRSASKFGGELDSLCDAISFGVAPAYLILRIGQSLEDRPLLGKAVVGIATLYMVCTLLRLARFNVENTPDPASHKRFRGLPSPGAAGCIASLAILYSDLPWKLAQLQAELGGGPPAIDPENLRRAIMAWTILGGLVIALLMVSRVPYPHLTKQVLRGRRHFSHLVQVILGGLLLVILLQIALVLIFWVYALGMAVRYTLARQLRRNGQPVREEPVPKLPRA